MRSTKLRSWTSSLLGLEPLAPPPDVFAVSAELAVRARIEPGESGWRCVESTVVDMPIGIFEPGELGPSVSSFEALSEPIGRVVSGGSQVTEATLVVPDEWVRAAFVEVDELPRSRPAREDVVRWMMKRFLPVRPEDVRLSMVSAASIPDGPHRLVVAFGRERTLAALEAVFSQHGVRIGRIISESLALVAGLGERLASGVSGVVLARSGGYSVAVMRDGEPELFRLKSTDDEVGDVAESTISRDLRLTRGFVEEQLDGGAIERVLVVASKNEETWRKRFEIGFGADTMLVTRAEIGVAGAESLPWPLAGALVGAVQMEVS